MNGTVARRSADAERRSPVEGAAPTTPVAPAAGQGGRSYTALLDATAELLAENAGFDVSLSEIAGRSGLNSALIKYYFGNKDGLLLALLERDARIAMGSLEHLAAMDLPAEEKLRLHIRGIVNAFHRSPYILRLIQRLAGSGDRATADRVVTAYVNPMLRAYGRIIDQGVAAGTMRRIDPGMLYYSLVGAADHLFLARYALRAAVGEDAISDATKQRYAEVVSDIFLRGLAA